MDKDDLRNMCINLRHVEFLIILIFTTILTKPGIWVSSELYMKHMKLNLSHLIWILGVFIAANVTAYYPEYDAEDALDHFDFYDAYGNVGVELDKQSRRITFKHKHTDGSLTYKHFRVDIQEENDQVIEFLLVSDRSTLLDESYGYRYLEEDPEIDFEKAYETFRRGYKAPKHQSHAKLQGSHIYRRDTRTKYIEDTDSKLITKVEKYTVKQTPRGLLYRVETTIPKEPFKYQMGFQKITRQKVKENLLKRIEKSGLSIEQFSNQFQDTKGEVDSQIIKEILEEILDETNSDSQSESKDDTSEDDQTRYLDFFSIQQLSYE